MDAALHDGSALVWLFVSIGLDTGRRHGEILGARLEHFDAVRRRLNVLVKGGSWPKQPLTRGVVSILVRDWFPPLNWSIASDSEPAPMLRPQSLNTLKSSTTASAVTPASATKHPIQAFEDMTWIMAA